MFVWTFRQWPGSFPISLLKSASLLTGPHKQGESGGYKRKMYHLQGNGWHDAFIFDQKYYCNPQALSPLIEQRGRRQLPLELQGKLPLQYCRKYPTYCQKIAVFVQQPSLRGLKTDWVIWRKAVLMTYLPTSTMASKPLYITFHKVYICHEIH